MTQILLTLYITTTTLFLLPSIHLGFIYTHGLGKLFTVILFALMVAKIYFQKDSLKVPLILSYLLLFYILTQGLSIINVQDISTYIARFSQIAVAITYFIVTVYLFQKKAFNLKKIYVSILIATSTITTGLIMILVLNPDLFIHFFMMITAQGTIDIIRMNIERNRIYFDAYNESLLPILLYLLYKSNNFKYKAILGLLSSAIALLSFLTAFRTRVVMTIFAIIAFFITTVKDNAKKTLIFIPICLFIFLGFLILLQSTSETNVIDRFQLTDERDVITIESRFEQASQAIEMAKSFPWTGTGLGNYYHYVDNPSSFNPYVARFIRDIHQDAQLPHNIFFQHLAETGFLGFLSITLLLLYFVIIDFKIVFKEENELKKIYAVSFWTLVVFGMLNPTLGMTYLILFWGYRALLC